MTAKDRKAFALLLYAMGEVFNESVSDARAEIYFHALEDLPLAAIQQAAKVYARGQRFFPKPVDLREAVDGGPDDRADLAWAHVLREVRRVGWVGTPSWPDAATERAALGLFGGGWRTLCEHLPAQGPELLGYAKVFKASFAAQARQHQSLQALPASPEDAKVVLADLKAALTKRGLPTGEL